MKRHLSTVSPRLRSSGTWHCLSRAEGDFDPAAMANALSGTPVFARPGNESQRPQGVPISTKYEIEDGKLQLSVYTMNRDQFSEVIVDHKTGAIDKSAAITRGEDLKDAGAQGAR